MLKTHPHLHIRQLEGCLGFSRQAYYQYWQRQTEQPSHEARVVELVNAIRNEHPRMGGRKLYERLNEELIKRGIKMGRDALFELLAAHKLLIRQRRRTMRTTFSSHRFRKYRSGGPPQPDQGLSHRAAQSGVGSRHYVLVYPLWLSLYFLGHGCLFKAGDGLRRR